jgi:putative flippase GtrA
MRSFVGRLVHDQGFRFLAVGATNTVVGYLIFAALTHWVFSRVSFGYLISLLIAYAVAIVMAFLLFRRFVFPVAGRVVTDFLRFVSVYLVSIGINVVALPLLVEFGHFNPLLAQAIVLAVTTLISFFGHKNFSFRRPSPPPDDVQLNAPETSP